MTPPLDTLDTLDHLGHCPCEDSEETRREQAEAVCDHWIGVNLDDWAHVFTKEEDAETHCERFSFCPKCGAKNP